MGWSRRSSGAPETLGKPHLAGEGTGDPLHPHASPDTPPPLVPRYNKTAESTAQHKTQVAPALDGHCPVQVAPPPLQ